MVVYIDILLLENFIINLFLLIMTMKLLRFNYKKRIYIAAMIGSVYTLIIFMQVQIATSFIFKLLICILMIYITMDMKNVVNVIKAVITFFAISFTLCGICFALVLGQNSYNIGSEFTITNSSIKYIILAIMVLCVFVVRLVDSFKERALVKNLLYDIEISYNGEKLYITGFLDTGNELREPVTNLPCIIVEGGYLSDIQIEENELFYIGYKTIGEEGKLKGFKCNTVRIKAENEDWKSVNAIVCWCKNKLSKDNEYNALLSRGVI